MSKMVDVGQKFKHLTVVAHEGSKVKCKCTCGVIVTMQVSVFLSGNRASCGHVYRGNFRNYPVNYTKGETAADG